MRDEEHAADGFEGAFRVMLKFNVVPIVVLCACDDHDLKPTTCHSLARTEALLSK